MEILILGVTRGRRRVAVVDLSLKIADGECLVFLGDMLLLSLSLCMYIDTDTDIDTAIDK